MDKTPAEGISSESAGGSLEKTLAREEEEYDDFDESLDIRKVVAAKERDPMMFVSGFEADDDGIVPADNPDDPGEKLLQAAADGNVEIVRELLDSNVNLLLYKDSDGYSALHRACYEDNLEVASVLLSYGAEVEPVSDEGWTPLHSACNWNAFHCVRLLLENGADVNRQTQGGLTPLHLACNNGNARETMIILLTEPNIKTDIANNANERAYEIARRCGNLDYLFEMHRTSIKRI